MDDQAGVSRKAFADQKLLADTLSGDLRVVREKVDDNNVRVSSLTQELEAVRMSLSQQAPTGAVPPPSGDQPNATSSPAGAQPPSSGAPPAPGVSPQRLYDMAWADYAAAQYDLAISGFEHYIQTFGKTEQAGDAQYFIGESYYQQGKFREAVAAYDRGISDYPNNKKIPDMYFKRGMAQSALGQTDRARESWEYVVKTFPNSDAGRLAKQRLEQLSRRDADGEDEQPEASGDV
jgi:tol-pal system protein YbgF